MPVTINITGDNAQEAILEFATLSAAFTGEKPVVDKPKTSTRKQSTKKEDPVKEDRVEEKEPVDVEEEKPEEKEPEKGDDSAEDVPKPEDLRVKAQEIGKVAANKPKIKALLDEFGAKNISTVPEDQRAEFLARLEELA